MSRKYVVRPDAIVPHGESEKRFVLAEELMQLYGVDASECAIAQVHPFGRHQHLGLISLRPQASGDYALPAE